jgi:OOP family OmpA-OmpF porin
MSRRTLSWRYLAAVGAISLLGACAQTPSQAVSANPPHAVASNPPRVAPGPNTIWYSVSFATDSFALDPEGQKVANEVITALRNSPGSIATIIGRTDTIGSSDYNMHLSHQRADVVRDEIVYGGKVDADRVETRWTGETRQDVPTANNVARAANRVVDIAIH